MYTLPFILTGKPIYTEHVSQFTSGETDSSPGETDTQSVLVDQPFATSEMGDSMDADLLPELSGEMWVASPYWTNSRGPTAGRSKW